MVISCHVTQNTQEVISKANAEEIAFEDIPESAQASAKPHPVQQKATQSTNAQAAIPLTETKRIVNTIYRYKEEKRMATNFGIYIFPCLYYCAISFIGLLSFQWYFGKVNDIRQKKYKQYENALLWLLPKIKIPEPPYEIHFKFGFSNSLSDWDNPIKPTQDILSKKYGFNDKLIRKAIVETEIGNKGKEYIEFKIRRIE